MVITQSKRVVLNLSGVTYIDSGGLGTLVALYTTARNNGGSIKLANLTQRVGDLLQVTKLVTIFDVYDSEEKALESFRKGVMPVSCSCGADALSASAPTCKHLSAIDLPRKVHRSLPT